MKIKPISDIHIEFHRDGGVGFLGSLPENADVVVVAGDFAVWAYPDDAYTGLRILSDKYRHVVYVPGNHEYYGDTLERAHEKIDCAVSRLPNVKWMHNGASACDIDGRRFVGATGWYPEPMYPELCESFADFGHIVGIDPEVFIKHRDDRANLAATVQDGDVVVSHHIPSDAWVSELYAGSKFNQFFVSNVMESIRVKPAVWVYGHTHTAEDFEYMTPVGWLRGVCNPLGYPWEYTGFDANKVIEL